MADDWYADAPMPALLRGAWTTYARAVAPAVADAGFDDLPRNGAYVVGAIAREGLPLSQVVTQLGVSKQAAGQLVDTLVMRGYLDRAADPTDRRRLTVSLTAHGEAAAAVTRDAVARVDAALTDRIGAASVQALRQALAVITHAETNASVLVSFSRPRLLWWTSPPDQPRWARPALLAIAAAAAAAYSWRLGSSTEVFYAAADRSMSMNLHNFFFGAFDPAGSISIDKLPGAFWLQAFSIRLFGVTTRAVAVPQVIEGVVTVLVLYRAVRRGAGPVAGIVASGLFAIAPATVTLNRGNVADTLLVLLLVLAADALIAALHTGQHMHLVLAGVWVGLAFQAKMLEAWSDPARARAHVPGRGQRHVRTPRRVGDGVRRRRDRGVAELDGRGVAHAPVTPALRRRDHERLRGQPGVRLQRLRARAPHESEPGVGAHARDRVSCRGCAERVGQPAAARRAGPRHGVAAARRRGVDSRVALDDAPTPARPTPNAWRRCSGACGSRPSRSCSAPARSIRTTSARCHRRLPH